jgi:FtsZ-binding cell division protein ZapB
MLAFLLSPFGKIVGYAVGILFIAGLIFGWYEMKIAEAKREALVQFNKTQLEEVVKEKNTLIDQMKALQDQQAALESENNKLNDALNEKSEKVITIIQKSKDNNFDPIFKNMIEGLRGK